MKRLSASLMSKARLDIEAPHLPRLKIWDNVLLEIRRLTGDSAFSDVEGYIIRKIWNNEGG